jgi:integrase
MDLAAHRAHPGDPEELVSRGAYRTVSRGFVRAVAAARITLRAAGREDEAARLDGVTWHALRHTFASRLVAAGVDLRTVRELGGWKTLSMVQRYAHLSPDHLAAAVEKIVAVPAVVASEAVSVREHRQNFDSAESSSREVEVRH